MPELRKDPIIDRWVIISTERAQRPVFLAEEEAPPKPGLCPLCGGNEAMTPSEVFAIRPDHTPPNTPGWTLRVVPNKFPALRIEGALNKEGVGLYDRMNGIGAHEVIIETPSHGCAATRANVRLRYPRKARQVLRLILQPAWLQNRRRPPD